MNVVEAPEMRIRDVLPGAILLFVLDPMASVADLNDEEATAAAARLQPGRFLVMVRRRDIDHRKPIHTQPLAFYLFAIGHGLPVQPHACVGLTPDAVHPEGRPPLLPTAPLPWTDCYVDPFVEFAAIVTRMHLSQTGPATTVSKDDHLAVLTYLFTGSAALAREQEGENPSDADSETSSVLCDDVGPGPSKDGAAGSSSYTGSGDTTGSECEREGKDEQPVRSGSEDDGSYTTDSSESGTDPDPEHSGDDSDSDTPSRAGSSAAHDGPSWLLSLIDRLEPADAPMLRLRGEIYLDLSAFDDFDSPDRLRILLEELDKIEKDWAKRTALEMLADQPRTTEWANEVAAAEPLGDHDSNAPSGFPAAPEDDIQPEDAIEHLISPTVPRVAKRGRKASAAPIRTPPPSESDSRRPIPHISNVGEPWIFSSMASPGVSKTIAAVQYQ